MKNLSRKAGILCLMIASAYVGHLMTKRHDARTLAEARQALLVPFPTPDGKPRATRAPARTAADVQRESIRERAFQTRNDDLTDFLRRLEAAHGDELDALFQSTRRDAALSSGFKEERLSLIIARITRERGIRASMDFINDSLTTGHLRVSVIYGAFLAAGESTADLAQEIAGMKNKGEITYALCGLAARMGEDGNLNVMDLLALKDLKLNISDLQAISSNLISPAALGDKQKPAEEKFANASAIFRALCVAYPDGNVLYDKFLTDQAFRLPYQAWNEITKQPVDSFPQDLMEKVAESMGRINPAMAMEEFLKYPSEKAPLNTVYSQWLKQDRTAAEEWLSAHATSFTPAQIGRVKIAEMSASLDQGDWSQAQGLIRDITDPATRSQAEQSYSQRLEGRIRMEMRSAPQPTLERLLTTPDTYEAPLLGVAMTSYLESNAVAAYDWYQTHSEKFTPQQVSELSASCARASIKAGDLKTATEWANQIQDESMKSSILSQVKAVK